MSCPDACPVCGKEVYDVGDHCVCVNGHYIEKAGVYTPLVRVRRCRALRLQLP
ncbi:hypothetical protein [Vulcanisaeta sp. JCM 16159]|uniref:hypothetical protein n=1 Tax=Vulcanisaeta sp. JCM 16159 TaxID=1295371 RepID=UPI000B0B70E5|nr:hypothetical protein [Vulcanisaeta sp. JCM 16159]